MTTAALDSAMFPYTIDIPSNQDELVTKFPGQSAGFVEVGDEKYLLPKGFSDFAEKIYNFEARASDIFICTFPRSGTTWTQEMIWLLCHNLDYKTATETFFTKKFEYLEWVK